MQLPPLEDLGNWLAERESEVPHLKPGNAKRLIWPSDMPRKAPLSVVYVHGFSASPMEVEPVTSNLAAALRAPFHATRLTGHGQDGAALAAATFQDWRSDVTEALAIGRAIGERVLVIGCSTGCTLLTLAMADGAKVAGAIMLSPNFGLRSAAGERLLNAPFSRYWAPFVAGRERSFESHSPLHDARWTLRYPTTALYPVAHAMRAVRGKDLSGIKAPTLFVMNEGDGTISPDAARAVMARWGRPVTAHYVTMGPDEDPEAHVLAGDAVWAGQNDATLSLLSDWIKTARIA